jgi:lipocalin
MVENAPGYEDFEAEVIMVVKTPDDREMCIVGDPDTKEIFVIPSEHVEEM